MFLGPCEVCSKPFRTYRSLSLHLRGKNLDEGHRELKAQYQAWRAEYRAILCCRNCKTTWESTDKNSKDAKLCTSCLELKMLIGKRQYEKRKPSEVPDPRQKLRGRKANWDGTPAREFLWCKGDPFYTAVHTACLAGEKVGETLSRLGVPYKTYKAVLQDALGVGGYERVASSRKTVRSPINIRGAHKKWQRMTPEEKAAELKRRFGKGSALEASFRHQIEGLGLDTSLNVWQSLHIEGAWRPREADLKISLEDGRKIVILCDGEAFHGPRYIYANPEGRVADDVATAEGYYALGYTTLRYSESEIHNGPAFQHFISVLQRLKESRKILRLWHPPLERCS